MGLHRHQTNRFRHPCPLRHSPATARSRFLVKMPSNEPRLLVRGMQRSQNAHGACNSEQHVGERPTLPLPPQDMSQVPIQGPHARPAAGHQRADIVGGLKPSGTGGGGGTHRQHRKAGTFQIQNPERAERGLQYSSCVWRVPSARLQPSRSPAVRPLWPPCGDSRCRHWLF
jgi:hypothetical protein